MPYNQNWKILQHGTFPLLQVYLHKVWCFTSFCSYHERGLRILGFPCNQFGKQEPGTNAEIKEFAIAHGAKFDLFSKIDVNGNTAHPLYKFLKKAQGGTFGDSIKWNFTKFLCNKKGIPVKRYSPTTDPLSTVKDIEAELSKE